MPRTRPQRGGLPGRTRRWSWSLRLTILGAFLLVLGLTVLSIVGFNRAGQRTLLRDHTEILLDEIARKTGERCTAYLLPAIQGTEVARRYMMRAERPLLENHTIETFAMDYLSCHPQLTMFNLADAEGNFIMPKEQPDASFAVKVIDRGTSPPGVVWKYYDRAGLLDQLEPVAYEGYDPRRRPWYHGAEQQPGIYWSGVYAFFTDGKPGITAARAYATARGARGGVGVDIALGELGAFLRSLSVSPNAELLIFNLMGETIARNRGRTLTPDGEDEMRPVRLSELRPVWLHEALRAYRIDGRPAGRLEYAGQAYLFHFLELEGPGAPGWTVGIVAPEDDFLGAFRSIQRTNLLISLAMLALGMLGALMLSRAISGPIVALAAEADRIRTLALDGEIRQDWAIREIRLLARALAGMQSGLRAFRAYLPARLVGQLLRTDRAARIGGEKREMSVLFTDIQGFTTISENTPPEILAIQLSRYFEVLTSIVAEEQGTVDKFIGDSVMAFWGAPDPLPRHGHHACRAALRGSTEIEALNARWREEGIAPLPTRFGIHSGPCVVGNVGSRERMNYTVLGDTVNIASRLEGANKDHGTTILVSEEVARANADAFRFRPIESITLRGRSECVTVYELLGEVENAAPDPPGGEG